IVARWTLRLTAAVFVGLSFLVLELLTFVPAAGAIAKLLLVPSQIAFAGWFARRYLTWQTAREAARARVAAWEWGVRAPIFGVILLVMLAVIALVAWIINKIQWLQGMLG